MAKKKMGPGGDGASDAEPAGETIAGYFRRILNAKPRLLKERSNQKLLQQWLVDHPDHTEVPQTVKNNLANLKSVLRSKKRKKVARRAADSQVPSQPALKLPVARVATGSSDLEELELQIDECLILAKRLDRDGLPDVIALLRRARNAVVWKIEP